MTIGALIGLSLMTIVVITVVAVVCYYYKKARAFSVIAGLIIVAAAVTIQKRFILFHQVTKYYGNHPPAFSIQPLLV